MFSLTLVKVWIFASVLERTEPTRLMTQLAAARVASISWILLSSPREMSVIVRIASLLCSTTANSMETSQLDSPTEPVSLETNVLRPALESLEYDLKYWESVAVQMQ